MYRCGQIISRQINFINDNECVFFIIVLFMPRNKWPTNELSKWRILFRFLCLPRWFVCATVQFINAEHDDCVHYSFMFSIGYLTTISQMIPKSILYFQSRTDFQFICFAYRVTRSQRLPWVDGITFVKITCWLSSNSQFKKHVKYLPFKNVVTLVCRCSHAD